jgi:serine/threonine protein kinase
MSERLRNISGFEILTKLSSGGMGDVLLARKKSAHGFEKLLAIKTIRGDLARRTDIRAMFLDEARLVARLDHPAITQVYDFGEEDGTLFLAMEYVAGIPLNKLLIKRGAALPPLVAARIAAEVARGLHAAHELTDIHGTPLGVVHRDVSPGNIILTFDGHVKIVDFGIAFMNERESPDTQLGDLKGKPSYMAPEQLRGERVDRRSDVYSLSVVLHEMLTGRKLFSKSNVVATALAVERGDVPPPSSIVGALPDGLDGVVMRGLEKEIEERFIDAKIMATALDDVLNQESAPPLVDFVETGLRDERESHRAWLQSVLSGEYTDSGTYETFPPTKASGPRAASRSGEDRARTPTPVAEAALAGPTTLVPPAPTVEQPVFVELPRRGPSPAWVAVAVFLAMVGLFIGSRLLSRPTEQAPIPALTAEGVVDLEQPAPDPAPIPEAPGPETDPAAQAEAPKEPPLPAPRPRAVPQRPKPKPAPAPVAKAEPEPDPDAFGFITVGAQPYALVRINGREVGATPIVNKKMNAGSYEIELTTPDTGEVRLKRTVVLREGQHARITAR